jgi:hypothetical protein
MRRALLLTLSIVVVLAVAVSVPVWLSLPKKTVLTIEVSGTNGLPLKGTAEVDGISQELGGTVPTKFVLEGYRVIYTLDTSADTGEFRVKGIIGGAAYGSAGSLSPPRYAVRGWVKSSWGGSPPTTWLEPFDRAGQPEWKSPP